MLDQVSIPACKWTNGGDEVLILKCVPKDGVTHNGFQWPLTVGEQVESPNWGADATCESGGLFGWPWGIAIGDGKEPDWVNGTWLVFGAYPEDVVDIGGKCKAHRGTVLFVGAWDKATEFILKGQIAWVVQASKGESSATGYRSASSATGNSSASSATGYSSASICTGIESKARGGRFGCIALAFWDYVKNRAEMRCCEIGCGDGSDGKLKADTWYRLNDVGEFKETE